MSSLPVGGWNLALGPRLNSADWQRSCLPFDYQGWCPKCGDSAPITRFELEREANVFGTMTIVFRSVDVCGRCANEWELKPKKKVKR